MGVPYVTKVTTTIHAHQAESSTEVTDAFQQAMFRIEEDAKKRNLEVAWGSMQFEESSPSGYDSIVDHGPWIVFDAIGRKS